MQWEVTQLSLCDCIKTSASYNIKTLEVHCGGAIATGDEQAGIIFLLFIFVRQKIDLNESRTLMLVKYLSRRFGYFQDLNSQILLACKEVCMVNISSNLFYIIFLMTAEFDITIFPSASSSRPSGTNQIRTRYNVGCYYRD